MTTSGLSVDGYNHYVFLDLSSRSPLIDDGTSMESFLTNRIALKCDTVQISTSKNIMAFPTPAIGIATGESLTVGLDLGMATKAINLSGIITEQTIQKQFSSGALTASKQDTTVSPTNTYTGADGNWVKAKLTAQEVCQLIHSYVDSSFMQSHQNLNNLLVLIPSRVGKDWLYRSGYGSGTEVETCPLMPFNYSIDTLHECALVNIYQSAINPNASYGAGQPGGIYPSINPSALDLNGVGTIGEATFDNGMNSDLHVNLLTNNYNSPINPTANYGQGQPGTTWPNVNAGALDLGGATPAGYTNPETNNTF